MASAALVDTSAIVAFFGRAQPTKKHYVKLFKSAAQELWALSTTWPCIVEAAYLLSPPERFAMMRWAAAGGINVFPIDQEALEPLAELMRQYTQSPRAQMDLADASLVWLAADTGVLRVMTTDVRDFSRYRLPDGRAFEIL
jgi:uncharacterized protein